MSKYVFFLSLFLLVSIPTLIFANRSISSFEKCLFYDYAGDKVILFGEIVGVVEEEDWYVSKFKLCGKGIFNPSFKIVSPKEKRLLTSGNFTEFERTEAYRWGRLPDKPAQQFFRENGPFAIKVRNIVDKNQILEQYKDFLFQYECDEIPWCKIKTEFMEEFGRTQKDFLASIKNSKPLSFMRSLILGVTVYSAEFGEIESLKEFENISTRNYLL